jgi:hypothetical protein
MHACVILFVLYWYNCVILFVLYWYNCVLLCVILAYLFNFCDMMAYLCNFICVMLFNCLCSRVVSVGTLIRCVLRNVHCRRFVRSH